MTATATVANDGAAAGTEVVQLYIRELACSFGARPIRELRGFRRLSLAAGESRTVEFTLSTADLGAWTPEGKWVAQAGDYELVIAPDAASGTPVPFAGSKAPGLLHLGRESGGVEGGKDVLRVERAGDLHAFGVLGRVGAGDALNLAHRLVEILDADLQQRWAPETFSPCTSPSFALDVATWIAGSLGTPK